jgi:hypothetical protein
MLFKTRKISLKGSKFCFRLRGPGREGLSAQFWKLETIATITRASQNYTFLRGDHNQLFGLRLGSRFGDDLWSVRFMPAARDGIRPCSSYFLNDVAPGIACGCTAPDECHAAIATMVGRGTPPYTPNKRNIVLVTEDAARQPVAAFGKLSGGGYGVTLRADVSPVIALAFGMAGCLSRLKPR